MSGAELTVVFVCTGNRFRSPLAAEVFRVHAAGLPVAVSSAGTLEPGSSPALDDALEHGAELGVDLSTHRAHGLGGEDLSGVDLIVGFEHAHIEAAVVRAQARAGRAFTLPELVRLLELAPGGGDPGGPVERARAAIARADTLRRDSRAPAKVEEIEDPLGLTAEASRRIALTIGSLTTQLADGLFGPRDAP